MAGGRVYVTPQGGRRVVGQPQEEEPWGSTASRSQFRPYEPSEVRNSRSAPSHVKPCLEQQSPPLRSGQPQPGLRVWHRHREDYPDPGSAVTDGSGTTGERGPPAQTTSAVPAWEQVHRRPIKPHYFGGTTHNQDDQKKVMEAAATHFPYRDEFAPRSKLLLYEMALERYNREFAKSEAADTASIVTVTTKATSAKGSTFSGSSRSSSTPNLPTLDRRLPTADSQRVPGGLARRRKECNLKAPAQWEPDREWFMERWQNDGVAGMASANFIAAMHNPTMEKYGENICHVSHILDGRRDHLPRGQKPG